MNFTLMLLLIKRVASSPILSFSFTARPYNSLNLKACGVWVNKELLLLRLNIWFFILYLIESFDLITGITALFFFKDIIIFFKSFKVKFGLAASCIKTLVGLYFLINFKVFSNKL